MGGQDSRSQVSGANTDKEGSKGPFFFAKTLNVGQA
jgi:hypothetical protein